MLNTLRILDIYISSKSHPLTLYAKPRLNPLLHNTRPQQIFQQIQFSPQSYINPRESKNPFILPTITQPPRPKQSHAPANNPPPPPHPNSKTPHPQYISTDPPARSKPKTSGAKTAAARDAGPGSATPICFFVLPLLWPGLA